MGIVPNGAGFIQIYFSQAKANKRNIDKCLYAILAITLRSTCVNNIVYILLLYVRVVLPVVQ